MVVVKNAKDALDSSLMVVVKPPSVAGMFVQAHFNNQPFLIAILSHKIVYRGGFKLGLGDGRKKKPYGPC
jgi:hypothetical protein